MKKKYIIPEIEKLLFYSDVQILANSDEHGTVDGPDAMGKIGDIVEEETGIPSNFSNIWGDEEDED